MSQLPKEHDSRHAAATAAAADAIAAVTAATIIASNRFKYDRIQRRSGL